MRKGQKMSPEQKRKISKAHLGVPLSEKHKKTLRDNHVGCTGKKMSENTKEKIRKKLKGRTRPNISNKLKKYTELEAIQNGYIHRWKKWLLFRTQILKRDNHICKLCRGVANTIHHLKEKKLFPELCWEEKI